MWKNLRFESRALLILAVMLVSVFVASVYMYDSIENETNQGQLGIFADNARSFVDENEAVAVFFGFEEKTEVENTVDDGGIDIKAEAAAYIERYNEIYESLK